MSPERVLVRTSTERIVIKTPETKVVRIVTAGPQGPKGDNAPNLIISDVPPVPGPPFTQVWVDTSS